MKNTTRSQVTCAFAVRVCTWFCYHFFIHTASLSHSIAMISSFLLNTCTTGWWAFSMFPFRPFTFACVDKKDISSQNHWPKHNINWWMTLIIYITYSCSLGICHRSIHIYMYTFHRNDCRSHHSNMYQLYSSCNLSYNLLMSTNIRSNYCFGLWLEPCAYCSSDIPSYYLFLHGYIHSERHSQGNMQSNNHLHWLK